MRNGEHKELGNDYIVTKILDVNKHPTYWLSQKGTIFSMYVGTQYPWNTDKDMVEMAKSCIPMLEQVAFKKSVV